MCRARFSDAFEGAVAAPTASEAYRKMPKPARKKMDSILAAIFNGDVPEVVQPSAIGLPHVTVW
jgi:hypothetical protein